MSSTTISSYTVGPVYVGSFIHTFHPGTLDVTSTGTIVGAGGTVARPAVFGGFLGAFVINDGLLRGGTGGAYGAGAINLSVGTLLNQGIIIGGTGSLGAGYGVEVGYGTFLNTGAIYSRGVGVEALAGQPGLTFQNRGSIGGGSIGVEITGASMYTSGTISGRAEAIYATGGSYIGLTIGTGAVFNGIVFDEPGNGTLVLAGSGAGSLDLGSSFIGFSGITFAPGSDWTLEGARFELAQGQTIADFGPGNTLVLDGFAATTESFAPGIGLILSNGTDTSTLHVNRPLPGNGFAVTSDGANTTIATTGTNTAPISIISTLYANEVAPGVGNYAAVLTITNTGTVASPGSIGLTISANVAGASIFNAGEIVAGPDSRATYHNGAGIFGGYSTATSGSRSGGFVENSGTIEGQNGIQLSGATVINTGYIAGNAIYNAGSYTNVYGGGIRSAELVVNSGTIYGTRYGVAMGEYGTLINSGTIAASHYGIAANFLWPSQLTILPGAEFDGDVKASGGSGIVLAGTDAGTIDMGGSFFGFSSIDFAPHVAWTLEGNTVAVASGQTITGFTVGDTIVLDSFAASSELYLGGKKLLLINDTGVVTLDLVSSFTSADFRITDNAQGGTDVSVALCYLRGTRLGTAQGERAVEDLRIGDRLPTCFGGLRPIKWIGRQRFAPAFAGRHNTPVRIAAGALGAGMPGRDLFISPGHSVLLEGRLILARNLVNGVTITQTPAAEEIDYFLIEFETHDCVLAEGIWAESYADAPGLRAQFHNVAEFYALYPDYVTPDALALCAPRPEHGPELAAALAPVVVRAEAGLRPGPLRGCIDICGPDEVEGWAQDEAHPHLPVALLVFDGGTLLGMALACDYRADLAAAGLGSGQCRFRFALARPVQHGIRILRVSDGAEIFAAREHRRAG